MLVRTGVIATAVSIAMSGAAPGAAAQEKPIIVFAAASLRNALDDISTTFSASTTNKVVISYAASSALIKQIEQGAPADIFISADRDWMDYAAQKKLIQDATRVNLLGNRLVLIAPADSAINDVAILPYFDLAGLAGGGRIVTGDVRAVPAGRYAKAALEALGTWPTVERRIAMVENVRAALALVARGEAPLGIVYETDARVEPRVKVVGFFPEYSHAPIVYPVALTTAAKPEAAAFLDHLRSAAAKAVCEHYGFTFLAKPAS